MAVLVKQFVNHFGLDLKSSDINRPQEYASGMMNAQYKKNGNISKREGYRVKAQTAGGCGLANYNRITPGTAIQEEILLAISTELHRLYEMNFNVSYVGAEASCIFEIFFDIENEVYKANITEGTVLVLDYSLGVGFDEATIINLADLKSQIDALPNFTATITGPTTIPAAFLDLIRSFNLSDSDANITNRYWIPVNTTGTLFPGNSTYKNDVDFENTRWTQLNNVIFFGNGYDEIIKYDGQTAFRAGMPNPSAPGVALGAAGVLTGAYLYYIV